MSRCYKSRIDSFHYSVAMLAGGGMPHSVETNLMAFAASAMVDP